jgi:carbon storage regulator
MLVLSRKVGERIRIGDSITVTVVRVSGGGVRLGIEAPPELPVVREEIYHSLQQHEAEARGLARPDTNIPR